MFARREAEHVDYKTFPFELVEAKAGDDGPQFTGYLSTFGNVDQGDDVVVRGAFDRTLREREFRPLLWSHEQRLPPIGVEKSLVVDEKGLLGTWDILDTTLGRDVYAGLKANAIRRMSMGYQTVRAEFDDMGVRKLLDVELLESSVVNVPMNDLATVETVKSALGIDDDVPFDQLLAQISEWLAKGADEAEALLQRRAEDERKLSDAHTTAITTLLQTAEAASKRLEAVIAPPTETPPAPQPEADDTLKLRLSIARKRLERRGILERSA